MTVQNLRLRVLPKIPPVDGRSVELRTTSTEIQWRQAGDEGWVTLVPLVDLVGPEGPAVEMRYQGDEIQWRVADGSGGPWNVLTDIGTLLSEPISRAESAADRSEEYAADAALKGSSIYEAVTGMATTPVPDDIHTIQVNWDDALGDGGTGRFIDSDNGTPAAFTSAAGTGATARDWYRAEDVSRPRLLASLNASVPLNVLEFGAVGDGITDDSAAFASALARVKTTGGTLYLPEGEFVVWNLRLEDAAAPYSIIGAGKHRTILRSRDGNGTLLIDNGDGDGQVGYLLQGFTVDNQHSVYNHPDARNGMAIFKRSNFTLRDIHIRDFKFSACLMWDDDNDGGNYENGKVIDCSCDGLGVGVNGFLFVNMDRCSYRGVKAKGLIANSDGPGHGVQFKNRCRYGSAMDIYAEDCIVGLGFAGDTLGGIPGPSYCTANNIRAVGCNSGLILGNNADNNVVGEIFIDQRAETATDAIYIEGNASGNSVDNASIMNLTAGRRAVTFRTGATDNTVHFGMVENLNETGIVALFDHTAESNFVRLSNMFPRMRTGNIYSLATFMDPDNCNSFEYENYPFFTLRNIEAGEVTLANCVPDQFLIVDTEGGAASDDLVTINNPYGQEGQRVTIRTNNDARDVVVKRTGNINLSGGADLTLSNRRSYLTLAWNTTNSTWGEVSRSENA